MIKSFYLIPFISFLIISSVHAQTFNFAKKQIDVWKLAKVRTLAVAQAMPEKDYAFKPVDGVMSFGQQMVHIANSMRSMNSRFILKTSYTGREKDATSLSKTEIIAILGSAFDEVIGTLTTMTDATLQTAGKSHGQFPLTKWQSLLFMSDHITNHRAKAVLYLRIKGVTPPRYGYN